MAAQLGHRPRAWASPTAPMRCCSPSRRWACGPGDEVITTAYTFFATAEAIARVGATPVFADIRPDTLNLDPDGGRGGHHRPHPRDPGGAHLRPAGRSGGVPRAGRPARARADRGLPPRRSAPAYEGRAAGSVGDIATFSFFPTKNLPAVGDGGAVATSNADLAERVRHAAVPRLARQAHVRVDRPQLAAGRAPGRGAAAVPAPHRRLERRPPGRRGPVRRAGPGRAGRAARRGARRAPHLPPVRGALRAPRGDRPRRCARRASARPCTTRCRCTCSPCSPHLGYRPGSCRRPRRAAREGLALPMFVTLDESRSSARWSRRCARPPGPPPRTAGDARLDRPHQLAPRR